MSRDFDGVDDSINTNLATSLTTMTFTTWYFRDTYGEGSLGRIIEKRQAGAQVQLWFNNGSLSTIEFDQNYAVGINGWSFPAPSASKWHHLAVTFDNTLVTNVPVMYLNGVAQSLTTVSATGVGVAATNADNYLIGNRGAGDRTFDGKLAFLSIWNRILSRDEIRQEMFFPGTVKNGILRNLPLFGGTTEGDYSGNINAATVSGATSSTSAPPVNGFLIVPRPNLYYPSFSAGVAPTTGTSKIQRMMLMGIS